jgi:hypothetical protein
MTDFAALFFHQRTFNIVTCIFIARQRFGKHIPAKANARNNRASIARQRNTKHASLTIEAVFSAWFMQNGYKEVFGSIDEYRTEVKSRVSGRQTAEI